ncbi:hypothetical protein [Aestuariimicrobium sp. Y1814]|uniref:hypothetical protein n=1 Tax=Aestuariimicrobium sp. Y1814 TaxID=3418742 RepID=UPI003DA75D3C
MLASLSDSYAPIQYVMLGGNAGDALINLGFFDLADSMALPFEIVAANEVRDGACVVVSGSGGLVPAQGIGGAVAVLSQLHSRAEQLVVLPSSIRGNEALLRQLGENVTLFARETPSYQHALANATGGATVLADHDMAFNLDVRSLLEGGRIRPPRLRRPKDAARLALYGVAAVRSLLFDEIDVMRIDNERSSVRRPWRLYNDLSAIAAYRNGDRTNDENTGRMLLAVLDQYSLVRTDRLHVGIGAHLLGKRVVLSDNSYGKLSGVYDFSLSSEPDVIFQSG